MSQVILGVVAHKSANVLLTFCSLHLRVFPLKITDNFLLTSEEILEL